MLPLLGAACVEKPHHWRSCLYLVREKWFCKLGFFFWSTTILEPDFLNQISKNCKKSRAQNKRVNEPSILVTDRTSVLMFGLNRTEQVNLLAFCMYIGRGVNKGSGARGQLPPMIWKNRRRRRAAAARRITIAPPVLGSYWWLWYHTKFKGFFFPFLQILTFSKNSLWELSFFNQLWLPISFMNGGRWKMSWEIKLI